MRSMPRRTRVAVVFGGPEHRSRRFLVSAGSILGAIDSDEFEIVPIGITREGRWVLTSGEGADGRGCPRSRGCRSSGTSRWSSRAPASAG